MGKKNKDKQGKFLISSNAMMNGLGNHCIKNNKPFSNDGIQNKQNWMLQMIIMMINGGKFKSQMAGGEKETIVAVIMHGYVMHSKVINLLKIRCSHI